MSPVSMIDQVDVMKEYLQDRFPEKIELIANNAAKVRDELSHLNREITTLLAPFKGASILTSHPSLGYFCKTYDLQQLTVECEGKSPAPRDVERLLKQLQHTEIRCAFRQIGFPDAATKKIARDLNVPLHDLDPYSVKYHHNLMHIARNIAQ